MTISAGRRLSDPAGGCQRPAVRWR